MMNKLQVFISYNHEDIDYARRLHRDLKNVGIKPWLDKDDILPGQDWVKTIADAIRSSRFFLFLLSSRMVSKRGFVHAEIKTAKDLLAEYPEGEIFIIPVRLDECEPPYSFLKGLQWVDMFPSWEEGIDKLLRAMAIENANQIPRPVHRVSAIVCDFRNFSTSARTEYIGERYSEYILHSLSTLFGSKVDIFGSDIGKTTTEHANNQTSGDSQSSTRNLYQALFGHSSNRYKLLIAGEVRPPTIAGAPNYYPGVNDNSSLLLKDRFGIYVDLVGVRLTSSLIQLRALLKSPNMWSRYDACFIVAGSIEEPAPSKYRALVRLLWVTEFDERTLSFEEADFDAGNIVGSAKELASKIRTAMNHHLNIRQDT